MSTRSIAGEARPSAADCREAYAAFLKMEESSAKLSVGGAKRSVAREWLEGAISAGRAQNGARSAGERRRRWRSAREARERYESGI